MMIELMNFFCRLINLYIYFVRFTQQVGQQLDIQPACKAHISINDDEVILQLMDI